ncbi:unnamed protein product [Dibothriocephalus latus]|uniref:Uncharacterized protein n=1 Tax=Dibothriocephalus latus TaxID=60516 RepID=A0A3P6RF03_DIBLA|nr:unnamed protein product [Dibothriocephalus latus]
MVGKDPGHGIFLRERGFSIQALLRRIQLRYSGHVVWMDDERLSKRLFHGDFAVEINRAISEELTQDRSTWRRPVQTGKAIYEDSRIAATKAKRTPRKSHNQRTHIVTAQALPNHPRCQRILHARIGLVGHFRTQCTPLPTASTSTVSNTATHSSLSSISTAATLTTDAPLPSSTGIASPTTP